MSLLRASSIEDTRLPQRCNASKPGQSHLTGQYESRCSCLFFFLEPPDPGLISGEGSPLNVTRPPHPHSRCLPLLIVCYHGEPSHLIRANFCCQETPFGPYSAQTSSLQTSSLSLSWIPSSPFCFEKGSRLFKRKKKMRTASLSHSRCIQCLALSKALKCKTDGGANKDQREQPCPPGLLSSHARRCCHSESRPRRLPRLR